MHILSLGISGMEKMAGANISGSISTKVMRLGEGSNLPPLDLDPEALPTNDPARQGKAISVYSQ